MKTLIITGLLFLSSIVYADSNPMVLEGFIRQAECSSRTQKGIFELLVKNGKEITSMWLKTDVPELIEKTQEQALLFGKVCILVAIAANNSISPNVNLSKIILVDGMVKEIDFSDEKTIEVTKFFERNSEIIFTKDEVHPWYFRSDK